MARIAGYRAVISASKGEVSRLSSGFCNAQINDRNVCATVHGATNDEGPSWTFSLAPVLSISSTGAIVGGHFARLHLGAADVEALRNGSKRLAIVDAD